MRSAPSALLLALTLGGALPSHAFSPSDAVLSASSHTYITVYGDQNGGTHTNDAPAALVGAPAGSTLPSSLATSRSSSRGTGSGTDTTTAGYGLITTTGNATVSAVADPFTDGDAQVDTTARFDDAVTFYNASFAPGAAFTIRLTMALSFASSVSANNFARVYAVGQGGVNGVSSFTAYESSTGNAGGDLGWHDPLVTTLDFNVVNGSTNNIWGVLTTKSESSLYNGLCSTANCTVTAAAVLNGVSATYTLSGVDPGLRVLTASGSLYGAAAAVPEPGAAALLLAGLLGLIGFAAARRRLTTRARRQAGAAAALPRRSTASTPACR